MFLKNPPIVEAVIDIECDLPPNTNFGNLDEDAKSLLKVAIIESLGKPYTQLREIIGFQGKFPIGPDVNVASEILQSVAAFQAVTEDGKQIVQVRQQGYSFNKLQPYGTFDEILPEIERTWRAFVELMKPKTTNAVRMRFINILTLPTLNGNIDLTLYLRDGPNTPDDDRSVVTNFLRQTTTLEIATGNAANTVLAIAQNPVDQPNLENQVSILFDNSAESTLKVDADDWPKISEKLAELRQLKNRTFSNMLTEKCLELYK
jgi:uncharacterized protein (TIGR04255 family)